MVQEGYKECPICCEEIKIKALVCRFCGAVLTDRPLPTAMVTKDQAAAVEAAMLGAQAAVEKAAPPEPEPETLERLLAAARGGKQRATLLPGLSEAITERYAGIDPEFGEAHRQRFEEFLVRSEDEYRTATTLFVDINGYTALSEKLSPENIKSLLDSFYDVCVRVVGRYNGFIVKYAGDACLAIFGAPVAYDRDAESAVMAGLEIREMVRLFPPVQGVKIGVSTGVATGTILSSMTKAHGHPEFDIFGPSVNLCARIEAVAEADTILICPTTQSLVKDIFELNRRPARNFKNVAEPVVTYDVVARLPESQVVRRDFTTPFLGREQEMGKLAATWEAFVGASPDSGASGCMVSGAPGIGKSRLLAEFLRQYAVPPARVLSAACAPQDAKIPYGMLRQAVAQSWDGTAGDSIQCVETALAGFLRGRGETGRRLAESTRDLLGLRAMYGSRGALDEVRGMGEGALRRLVRADLMALLSHLAADGPVVLFLDDVQWADASSLELLDALATPPCIGGIYLLLAHRSGYRVTQPHVKDLRKIVLRELDEESRRSLFGHLANIEEILPEIRSGLIEQSSGNPLFLVELVRALAVRVAELEASGQGGSHLAEHLREWVPPSLKGLLQSRIDLLDQRRKLVLQCGAVLGQRFEYRLIELFELVRSGLLARLYSLKGLEFLDDVETPRELEFLFRHHLIRAAAYQTLLERQRAELHGIVAKRLETQYTGRLDEIYPVLAHHHDRAGNRERAIHYLHLAGNRATAQAALTDAVQYYDAALEKLLPAASAEGAPPLAEADQLHAASILRARGRVQRLQGQAPDALDSFARARALPAVEKETLFLTKIAIERALTHIQVTDYASARGELETALPAAEEHGDPGLLAMAWNARGFCDWGQGLWAPAREAFDRTLALANRAGNDGIRADALNNLGLLEWKAGRLDGALERFHEALLVRHKLGDRFDIARTLMNLGIVEENLGHYDEAQTRYEQALELAESLRYTLVQSATCANLGNLALVRGYYAAAQQHNARSLELARAIGDLRSQAIALENLALGHTHLLDAAEARRCLTQARRIANRTGDLERLFSLDLAEVESLLLADPQPHDAARQQRQATSKIARAHEDLSAGSYRAELPRLLRLEARAHFQTGNREEGATALRTALTECAAQKNASEELHARALAKEFGVSVA